MATIRERKSASGKTSWHAQVRVKGHEAQTRSFERKSDSKAWAEETERLIRAGRFRVVNESQERDFSELCQRFREKHMRASRRKDYSQILDWWESRMGRLRLINVTAEVVQKHLDELMDSPSNARRRVVTAALPVHHLTPVHILFGVTPSVLAKPAAKLLPPQSKPKASTGSTKKTSAGTGLRYLAVLSRVFNVCVKQLNWLDKSPVDGVQRPEQDTVKIPRVLSPAEEQRLIQQADAHDNRALQYVARIALCTGMRLNEIMRLRWNDIDFRGDHALLHVRQAKNKRQRMVPLAGDALDALVRLRIPRGDVYSEALLFPSKKNAEKPVLIRAAWNTCLKNAGIERFRFHDLRHTMASRLASQNFSLPRIGNILGHVDHRSTSIYTHFAQEEAIQMVMQSAQASAAALAKLGGLPVNAAAQERQHEKTHETLKPVQSDLHAPAGGG